MNINEINKLNLILIKQPTDELEIIDKLVVEILAVRKEIATANEREKRVMK